MAKAGFKLLPGEHPIVPVMLYEAPLAQEFAKRLLDEGVYVIGFFFPVVPKGLARIRTQMSAAHTREDLDHAIAAFAKVGRELGRDRLIPRVIKDRLFASAPLLHSSNEGKVFKDDLEMTCLYPPRASPRLWTRPNSPSRRSPGGWSWAA